MKADELAMFCKVAALPTPVATKDCMVKLTITMDKKAVVSCNGLVVSQKDGFTSKFSMDEFDLPIDANEALQIFGILPIEGDQECAEPKPQKKRGRKK